MKRLLLGIAVLLCAANLFAQGMPIDSLMDRFSQKFNPQMLASLREQILVRYDEQRVWGLDIGDFSNDSLPDLAISVYDIDSPTRDVTVYLLINDGNKTFKNVFRKKYGYVETPIEVGLTIDESVVTIIQKSDEDHWNQEGYTVYAGDVVLIDDFQSNKEAIPATSPKAKSIGHSLYRNYETLFTKETYFTAKNMQSMVDARYFTFPAYSRLRSVYPGYGKEMSDTSKLLVIKGLDYRHDSKDLSVHRALAAFDDEYLYYSISVTDDAVYGGNENLEANDRVSLWFDTWAGDDRFLVKTKKGSLPKFRTETDSNIYNITFSAPNVGIRNAKVTVSSAATLTDAQQEAAKLIRSKFTRDTASGIVTGYTLMVKIPFAFLGYESNPVTAYENRSSEMMFEKDESKKNEKNKAEKKDDLQFPHIGFTAVVYDIDNPAHPEEVTVQATSNFRQDDPTSFGELHLIPSGKFYGAVKPTYMKEFTQELLQSGY
jgi:hypothetical protein